MRSQPDAGHGGESYDGEGHDVDKIIRLHHRRRGWAWVGCGSLIGLIVYFIIGAALFANLTGTAETASLVPVFVLLALAVVGLVTALVDTLRLRGYSEPARREAKGNVVHHPVYAHAHRYPPRHPFSWAFGVVMLAALAGLMVIFLPWEVNSVGYLTGAESTTTFHPVSYAQACGRGGCHNVTDGFLADSGADVTWGSQVPLNQSFPVRVPAWDWGTGHTLIDGDGTAIAGLIVGLIFNAFAIMLLLLLVMLIWIRRRAGHPGRAAAAAATGHAALPLHTWTPGMAERQHYQAMPPADGDIGSGHEQRSAGSQRSAGDAPADDDPA
jgi:hypothetical protein